MTVENTISKTGKQVMGAKTYDFIFDDLIKDPTEEAAKAAIKCLVSNGKSETKLIYGRDYTVELNQNRKGGRVTLTDPKNADWRLVIYRSYEATQEADYNDFDSFPAETLEQCLDKVTMLIQEIKEELDRCIKVPITGDISPDEYMDAFLSDLGNIKNLAAGQAESAAASANQSMQYANLAEYYANNIKFGMRRVDFKITDWQQTNGLYQLFFADAGFITGVFKKNGNMYEAVANADFRIYASGVQVNAPEPFAGYVLIPNAVHMQYIHANPVASVTWDITHDMNCYPHVTCMDTNGVAVIGTVKYIDLNHIQISFTEAVAGKAVLG